MTTKNNISTAFKWNAVDARFAEKIIDYSDSDAIAYFTNHCDVLTDYAYWFYLSTLWVKCNDYLDLEDWKKLFNSSRSNKAISLMKPDELSALAALPNKLTIYRAQHVGERDWIAYTLDLGVAKKFAKERNAQTISVYTVKKRKVLALFLRRDENEIIVLDKNDVKPMDALWLQRGVK